MAKKTSELTWKEAVARRDELLTKCDEHYKLVGDNDPTEEQRKEVIDYNKEIEELEHKIDESSDYHEVKSRLSAAYERRQGELSGGGPVHSQTGDSRNYRPQMKTLGESFTEFKPFTDWVKAMAGGEGKEINESISLGQSPIMPYSRKELMIISTGSATQTSAGALTRPDYQPMVRLPFAPMVLRDLVSVGTTGSDTVTYPREVSRTNAAAVVREATATAGTSGQKPESGLKLEKVIANVKNVAHWIPCTRQALSDAGQLRLLTDSFLLDGLEQVVERELLQGDGTDDHLLGVENTPGTQFQEFDTDVLKTLRKARTKCEVDGLAQPTAYVMNPRDWEGIELLKDGTGRYYYGGPSVLGNPRVWGLPVVCPYQQFQGTAFCADWKTVAIWDREQGNIRVAEQHSDFFTRNMVVILAEERLANGVFRPAAIVKIDLQTGANS